MSNNKKRIVRRVIDWFTKDRYIGKRPPKSPGFFTPMDIAPGETLIRQPTWDYMKLKTSDNVYEKKQGKR